MGRGVQLNDSRLFTPGCSNLQPVTKEMETPWFTIWKRGDFYSYEAKSAQVTIVPIVDSDHLIMVHCKRPLMDDAPLELPAGGFLEKETPQQAARRELAEETGVKIQDLKRFHLDFPFAVMSGRSPHLDHAVTVHINQSEWDQRSQHDAEIDQVCLISFKDAIEKIRCGEIYSIVPMALIQREYLKHLEC